MSVLFGYMGNEPQRIRCALHLGRDALTAQSATMRDGWGIGFYQAGEGLLQKRPKAGSGPADFYRHLCELRSDVVLGHVNDPAPIDVLQKPEETDPYRFRTWLFASSGRSANFETFREALLGQIPDFLRRNI